MHGRRAFAPPSYSFNPFLFFKSPFYFLIFCSFLPLSEPREFEERGASQHSLVAECLASNSSWSFAVLKTAMSVLNRPIGLSVSPLGVAYLGVMTVVEDCWKG